MLSSVHLDENRNQKIGSFSGGMKQRVGIALTLLHLPRILVVDEIWILMQHEESAEFLFGIAKRARKYFLGLTAISQDVTDVLNSNYGKPIVTNSSMQLLLKQSPASMDIIQSTFNLTEEEKYMLLEGAIGEGLFFAGQKHVAIKIIASNIEDQIITSDPEQLLRLEKIKKEQLGEE